MTTNMTTNTDRRWGRVGLATRRGIRPHNMDAVAMFESCNAPIAIAVVDGIGNDEHGATAAVLAP
jgi:hypothetical protein